MDTISIIKLIIFVIVMISAPFLLISGIWGSDTSHRKWMAVCGTFLTVPVVFLAAILVCIMETVTNDAFSIITTCFLPLLIFAFGASLIVVADEKTQTQKWCARICGILICFISISAFFTAYSIMGSREGIKNFIGNSGETQNITENSQTDFSNYSDWNLQSNSTGKIQIPLLDSELSQSVAETQPTAKKEIRLGIVQEGQSAAMDAANHGILKALEDNNVYCEDDQQNACGDSSTMPVILEYFKNANYDGTILIVTGNDYSSYNDVPHLMILNVNAMSSEEAYQKGYALGEQMAVNIS